MVQSCCVPECQYYEGKVGSDVKRVSLFNFPQPKDKEGEKLKKQWLKRIRRQETCNWKVLTHTKVCSEHFKESDFYHRGIGKKWCNRRLKNNSLPSRFKWINERQTRPNPLEKCREFRSVVQTSKKDEAQQPQCLEQLNEIQMLRNQIQELQSENSRLNEEVCYLKAKIEESEVQLHEQFKFSYERFKNNSQDIRFYTSFASPDALEHCYNFLNPGVYGENIIYCQSSLNLAHEQMSGIDREEEPAEVNSKQRRPRTLDPKTEFVLCLCRVRQGFRERHLAHLFNCLQNNNYME